MRAEEFTEDNFGTSPKRSPRSGSRHPRGHEPVERYHKVEEDHSDFAVFEIDSENAYNHVMDKFGHVIEWQGDYMVVPRKYWPAIEELAFAAGGEATEITDDQLNELSFLGSQCTKDCSGHRAGYEWSQRNQRVPMSWSPSFNKGAALQAAGK